MVLPLPSNRGRRSMPLLELPDDVPHSSSIQDYGYGVEVGEMPTVYTIGHSNQPADEFDALLLRQSIERVVDVRSRPRSRFGQFNGKALAKRLTGRGIEYLYLGDQLGGYPEPDALYDDGRVVYERVAALPHFRSGIKRVAKECEQQRMALMCAQEDPKVCHRHPLLASALLERGVEVLHLRRDGSVQDAATMTEQTSLQLPLLEPVGEDLTWRSPKRIPRR